MGKIKDRQIDWENGLISDKEFIEEIQLALFHLTHEMSMRACADRQPFYVHQIVSLERSICTGLRKLADIYPIK